MLKVGRKKSAGANSCGIALPRLRADNLRVQCGDEGSLSGEEGRGFFELGSRCAEEDGWHLGTRRKNISPQKAVEQLGRRRERVVLQLHFLLWWLSVEGLGAGIQETIRCSVWASEQMLTDADAYSQNS